MGSVRLIVIQMWEEESKPPTAVDEHDCLSYLNLAAFLSYSLITNPPLSVPPFLAMDSCLRCRSTSVYGTDSPAPTPTPITKGTTPPFHQATTTVAIFHPGRRRQQQQQQQSQLPRHSAALLLLVPPLSSQPRSGNHPHAFCRFSRKTTATTSAQTTTVRGRSRTEATTAGAAGEAQTRLPPENSRCGPGNGRTSAGAPRRQAHPRGKPARKSLSTSLHGATKKATRVLTLANEMADRRRWRESVRRKQATLGRKQRGRMGRRRDEASTAVWGT